MSRSRSKGDARWSEIKAAFAGALRADRERHGETVWEYAEYFGLTWRVINDLENEHWPSWSTVGAMADVVAARSSSGRRKPPRTPKRELSPERCRELDLDGVSHWICKGQCDIRRYHPQWFYDVLLTCRSPTTYAGEPGRIPPPAGQNFASLGVLLAFRELVPGPFEANGVVLKHNREQFRPDPQLAQPILAELVSVFDAAYTAGIEIREAPLARLVKYVKRKRLTLEVQPTVYSLFAAMNLGLRGNGPFATAIRKKWGTTGAVLNARPSPLPDPLNVIAVLVSSDDHIFISQRTSGVYERPCCFQATVGGAIAFSDESPAEAIKREFLEEFGLQVFDSQIRFLALGRNLLTGEPDLLAVVHSAGAAHEITPLFTRRISKEELLQVLDFDLADAKKVIKAVNRFPFSQDSDRAAILLALREKAGPELIQAAVRAVR